MLKLKFVLLFCGVCWFAQAQSPEKYHRASVSLVGKNIADLAALGIEVEHGDWQRGRSFSTDFSESEIALMRKAGFQVDIQIEDVSAWYVARSKMSVAQPRGGDCNGSGSGGSNYPTPANYTPGSMGGYHTYQEMLDVLADMRAKFPSLISVRSIVSDTLVTHEGRPLYYWRISDNPDDDEAEPSALYTAMHHCREPNGMTQMLFYMWHLLENYATDPNVRYIVDNTELYFIPCVNPDGYLYNQSTNPSGGGLWRKNRRANNDGTFGVDLNRNYGYEWGFNDQGSSPNGISDTYRGPGAFSEPETRMIRDFCREGDFQIALNYHTFSNLLIYPWGYSDILADPIFKSLAELLTRENHYKTGTASETVGYAVNGTTDDWMFAEKNIYSLTPEVGPGAWGFWPPEAEIDGLNRENVWQNLAVAYCLLRFGEVTDKSEATIASSTFSMPFELTRYGFQDGPLTVSLSAVSSGIASIGPAQNFDIQQFETVNGSFDVTLQPSLPTGTTLKFLLKLSNGTVSWADTLTKTYGFSAQTIFSEPANTIQGWVRDNWNITPSTYVSAPNSFADSPNGDYDNNENNAMTLKIPVEIPADAQLPRLRFFAKWSIEQGYDYVRVLASPDNVNWTPLCGLFTKPGINSQPNDEPVFDGQQADWVEECMDLSAFVGQSIRLRYELGSDGFQEFDGFYFDDARIEFNSTTGTQSLPLTDFVLEQNKPNPSAQGSTVIAWQNRGKISGEGKLLIFNAFGQEIAARSLNFDLENKVAIDTRSWAAGTYFYQIRTERGVSELLKMVVAK